MNTTPEHHLFRIIGGSTDDRCSVQTWHQIEGRVVANLDIYMSAGDVESALFDFLKTGKSQERVRGQERLNIAARPNHPEDLWIDTPNGRFVVKPAELSAYILERSQSDV